MPCNSDYMMPTAEEISRLSERCNDLKGVADDMVYSADIMREAVLACNGDDLAQLDITDVIDLTRRVARLNDLIDKGDKLVEKIRGEYAFNNTGNKHKAVIDGYLLNARAKYLQAAAAAEVLLGGRPVDKAALDALEQDQVEHRMEDVKRLIKVFTSKGDFKMVEKLAKVDFEKPLQPQIGIDPDDY